MSSAPPTVPLSRAATAAFAERRPPYSIEAEMSVLGGMFIDSDAVVKAIEVVDDSMFYREGHRRLYRAMVRLWEQNEVIDSVTLAEQLKSSGDF
jgi:replicative DNA helicase